MRRGLSQRESVLLSLFHVISLLIVASTAASVDADRSRDPRLRRSEPTPNDVQNDDPEAAEAADKSCRCAADQWAGVLLSVDREFYLVIKNDLDDTARQRLGAAETESNTAIFYDYRNKLFASLDFDTGVKTVIDYNMVGYLITYRDSR